MRQTRHILRNGLLWIGHLEMTVCAVLLLGIVLMILVQVLLNAGLGNPITWEQEAGAYALVWMTFLGASIGVKYMRHVTIISFIGKLPLRLRYLVRAATYAVILWTLYVLMRELFPIMNIEARSTTVALPIDLPRSYFFSVPLLVSCTLMTLTTVFLFFEAVIGVFTPEESDLLKPIMEHAL